MNLSKEDPLVQFRALVQGAQQGNVSAIEVIRKCCVSVIQKAPSEDLIEIAQAFIRLGERLRKEQVQQN